VIVVDSSALVAIMRGEPETERFLETIAAADALLLSAVNYLETSMVLAGPKGETAVWRPLDALLARANIEVAAFDREQAQAARLAFLRFGKGRHPAALNFGDCAAYALAKARRAPLLFKGEDFPKTDIAPAIA
jgi:ribonuclease VapC